MATSTKRAQLTATRSDDGTDIPDWAKPATPEDGQAAPEGYVAQPVSERPAMDALLAWLAAEAGDPSADKYDGLESIIAEVLGAADMAAVLRKSLPQSGADFVGIPMLLKGYRIEHSAIEDGSGAPFYAALQVEVGNPPEPRVINCSGWKVLAQVAAIANVGGFPCIVTIEEARKAKKGQNAPLTLVAYEPE